VATSSIEWTNAVWNPCVGCTKVSPGCKHCYALTMHRRLTLMGQAKYAEPFEVVKPYPEHLAVPLGWRKPRRVFVNSMSDLFHEDLPNEYIAAVFGVMAAAQQHTFQVLTKRAGRMRAWFEWFETFRDPNRYLWPSLIEHAAVAAGGSDALFAAANRNAGRGGWPLPNVWLGVTAENQKAADERVPELLRCPAAVHIVSYEPALEAVDFSAYVQTCRDFEVALERAAPEISISEHMAALRKFEAERRGAPYDARLSWVIVGGESGNKARPFNIDWARQVVAQCKAAGVAVFVKQVGAKPFDGRSLHLEGTAIPGAAPGLRAKLTVHSLTIEATPPAGKKGGDMAHWPEEIRVREYPTPRRVA
jgi:protein gp37